MTSELRPAVAVAGDCHWEYEFKSEEEAAAIIEADREAVRAEQAAEIERLREALTKIANLSPAVTHGWAEQARSIARQALTSYKEQRDA